jgi:hypothetical protein
MIIGNRQILPDLFLNTQLAASSFSDRLQPFSAAHMM